MFSTICLNQDLAVLMAAADRRSYATQATERSAFLDLGDLARRFRDDMQKGTKGTKATFTASSRLAAPERPTNCSHNCFLNASSLLDQLNSSKSLNISMATSTDGSSLVMISSTSIQLMMLIRQYLEMAFFRNVFDHRPPNSARAQVLSLESDGEYTSTLPVPSSFVVERMGSMCFGLCYGLLPVSQKACRKVWYYSKAKTWSFSMSSGLFPNGVTSD
jgi:hypothetical protein